MRTLCNFTPEIKEALGSKKVKLTRGSLFKLVVKDRLQYLPKIKEILEQPDRIIKDKGELLFIKQIKSDLFLTSVGKDYETHITIISNAPKTDKTIQNRIDKGEVIYNAEGLLTSKHTLTDKAKPQVSIGKDIIPQKS